MRFILYFLLCILFKISICCGSENKDINNDELLKKISNVWDQSNDGHESLLHLDMEFENTSPQGELLDSIVGKIIVGLANDGRDIDLYERHVKYVLTDIIEIMPDRRDKYIEQMQNADPPNLEKLKESNYSLLSKMRLKDEEYEELCELYEEFLKKCAELANDLSGREVGAIESPMLDFINKNSPLFRYDSPRLELESDLKNYIEANASKGRRSLLVEVFESIISTVSEQLSELIKQFDLYYLDSLVHYTDDNGKIDLDFQDGYPHGMMHNVILGIVENFGKREFWKNDEFTKELDSFLQPFFKDIFENGWFENTENSVQKEVIDIAPLVATVFSSEITLTKFKHLKAYVY